MSLSILQRGSNIHQRKMSFIEHLEALRWHLFRSFIAIAVGALVVGFFNKFFIQTILMGPTHADFPTYSFLCKMGRTLGINQLCMEGVGIKMQSIGVSNQLSMFFTVVLIGGIILAFPYIFYQFWKFIKPALNEKELQRTNGVIFWVSLLFFLGVLFGYFVIAPYTVNFFANFQIDAIVENRWTINSYIDTLVPLILGTGLAFQLPLAMLFLSKIGLASSSFLAKKRKHAIVIILIVAGIITPPDVLSQIIVTLPMLVLYEISILLVRQVEKKKQATG